MQTFLEALFSTEEFKRKLKKQQKSWAKEANFNIKGAFTRDCFVGKSIRNDVDFVSKAVGDQSLRNLLLSPSTVKRPDFEAVMSGKSLWFLSASSKLYSNTYDDSDESDLRSTAPQMFYMKKMEKRTGIASFCTLRGLHCEMRTQACSAIACASTFAYRMSSGWTTTQTGFLSIRMAPSLRTLHLTTLARYFDITLLTS